MSFGILPTEVVELILISAATDGFPHAIAAFAQTSKFNRALVYESKDQHLWREVFLATFDDPRASGGGPGWAECTSKHSQASTSHTRQDSVYDWEGVFKQRIWAADYIRTRTNPEPHRPSTLPPETTHRNIRALDTLSSVISTALPCPPTIVFSFLSSGDSPDPASPSYSNPHAKYPTFPPVPQAINGPSNNLHPDTGPATFGQAVRALNTAWLESVLSKGLPPDITASFSAEQWEGGLTNRFLNEERFYELQAAARIIACTGFVPTPQAVAELAAPPSPYGPSEEADASMYMSPAKQLERARRLARMRVYNLRYLTRERHWGPFLERDFTPSARRPSQVVPENDDDLLQPLIELFRLQPPHVVVQHHHHHDSDEEEDDDEDADYTPGHADESTSEEDQTDTDHMSEDDRNVGDHNAPEDEDEDMEEPVAQTRGPGESPPTSAQLRADWAYLAAVRVVVEANLRETFGAQDLRGLLSLDGLRAGSAPWDVSAYRAPLAEEQKGHPSSGSPDTKGKAKDTGAVEGWDWAGVTGVWMYVIFPSTIELS